MILGTVSHFANSFDVYSVALASAAPYISLDEGDGWRKLMKLTAASSSFQHLVYREAEAADKCPALYSHNVN